ncbi:MAG TPA: PEP-CTERM sorting domain-containing protein [Candidatus Angelobacter sp.]|nr:PEP-CTERM sorting domain-containing protein [Candidatus Angelobacter sp.]
MKKFAYFWAGISLLFICSVSSGASELHEIIASHIERFNSFPESGSLIVLGSVLIFGASILRRRRAARSR